MLYEWLILVNFNVLRRSLGRFYLNVDVRIRCSRPRQCQRIFRNSKIRENWIWGSSRCTECYQSQCSFLKCKNTMRICVVTKTPYLTTIGCLQYLCWSLQLSMYLPICSYGQRNHIYITFREQIFYPSLDGVEWCHSKGLPVCDQESVTGFIIDPVGSSLDILF